MQQTNELAPTTPETTETADLEPEHEEVFDPQSIVRDIIEDDRNGRNLRLCEQYEQAKTNLIGSQVQTSAGLTWIVRGNVLHTEVEPVDSTVVGVRNFDFNNKRMKTSRGLTRINFLDLLCHLWPGDWRVQLTTLNHRIHEDYKEKVRMTRHGRVKKVHEITEREFWVFWGILLAARLEGRRGGKLWDRSEPDGYGSKVDLSRHMKEHRFLDIKRFVPFLFVDESKKGTDPWWQFSGGVESYNTNRKKTIKASPVKVFDESMSAFRPRTSRFSNLPHLSCIDRKPEPLGTEFKVTNTTTMGVRLYLEIQRGCEGMANAEFVSDMKKTAACCCRMAKGTVNGSSNTYLGDSWFASVDAVVEMKNRFGANFIGVIKTNHSKYPKKWLEDTMKEWPPGSHLVLEARLDGVDVLACGYKFVFSKGSGHTQAVSTPSSSLVATTTATIGS